MRETTERPAATTLERLSTLRQLGREKLQALAQQLPVYTATKGEVLLEFGSSDPAILYLLRGRLQLTATDGAVQAMADDDPSATNPIARLRPSRYEVRAATPVSFLRIGPELVGAPDEASDPNNTLAGYEVNEEDDCDNLALAGLLTARLYTDLDQDRLLLPSLPDVAVRVGQAVANENADAHKVARAIEADPAIATKLLRTANSARFRGQTAARTVDEAVVRLGLPTTHRLVVTFALREVFRTHSGTLREQMRRLWQHSCRVAALSQVLARKLGGFDPEFALLAGLVHDLGAVAVLAYAAEQPAEALDEADLAAAVAQLRGPIGGVLLHRWQLPAELVAVAEGAEDWHRAGGGAADVLDLVIIAQLHSFVGSEHQARLPAIDSVPSYGRLGLGALSPAASLQILDEAATEIRATEALLGA